MHDFKTDSSRVAHDLPRSAAPSSPVRPQRISPCFADIRYLLILLLVPLLAIPAFIVLGKSDFFLHHGASIWVQSNDAIFDMHDRHCNVLVFGDSTAMTGVNPEVIEQQTGRRTCNIAVTNAVLAVTDNLALDHFLAHNAAPQILLVQLSPDDFQQRNRVWQQTIYAEGLLELLRHGSASQVRSVLLHHPRESVAFAGYTAGYTAYFFIRRAWSAFSRIPMEERRIVVRNGFFTPPTAARSFCLAAEFPANPSDRDFPRAFIDGLRRRYSSLGSLVLVDVAPIPACDENLLAYRSQLAGLTSNSLLALPITLFNDGRHYTAAGSHVVSNLIAQQLNEASGSIPETAVNTVAQTRPGHLSSLHN